jgi:hypothetical protein
VLYLIDDDEKRRDGDTPGFLMPVLSNLNFILCGETSC